MLGLELQQVNFSQNKSQGSLCVKFIISYWSEDAWVKQRPMWQVWGSQWLNIYISQSVCDTDICRTVITWVSPSGCNLTGAAHLLLCGTKPKPIPALNCSQGLAGLSKQGWGSSSSEKPVGWKWGEGGQSQAQLGAGTCSAASQPNVVFYWLIGGTLLGSMLHIFNVQMLPSSVETLAALAGEDLFWQSHVFSSQKWRHLIKKKHASWPYRDTMINGFSTLSSFLSLYY